MNEYSLPFWEQEANPDNPAINPKGVKGLWIPEQILYNNNLTYQEKLLLTFIFHLDTTDNHCYASNKYLGELMNCTEKTIANILSGLKKKNAIETVSWDGRIRKLKVSDNFRQ